jgi:hypothetical protein
MCFRFGLIQPSTFNIFTCECGHRLDASSTHLTHYPFGGQWIITHDAIKCRNLNFGLATKVRACKGAGQGWSPRVTFMFSGMQENVREWTPTLPSEVPLWELKSQWIPKFLEGDGRGQDSLVWIFFYIIGKLLECRCLKWARMTHLST